MREQRTFELKANGKMSSHLIFIIPYCVVLYTYREEQTIRNSIEGSMNMNTRVSNIKEKKTFKKSKKKKQTNWNHLALLVFKPQYLMNK